MRPTFYIAGPYVERRMLKTFADTLRGMGFYVHAEWLEGTHEEIDARSQQQYARRDFEDIYTSDALILYNTDVPSSGRAIEFGYAYANNKDIYIIGPKTSVFHHLVTSFDTFQDFYDFLKRRYL